MSLASQISARAKALKAVRAFFDEKGLFEVDTPHLSPYPSLDQHIEAMPAASGFLHTSPERAMKLLLSQGAPDIYQICHVFRKDEIGRLHSPEFTLIEYYRTLPYEPFIAECIELINLFIEGNPTYTTYQEALTTYAPPNYEDENIAWGLHVEPNFQKLTVVTGYPTSNLAKRRFEIYYKGVELANGYDENTTYPYPIRECCGVALGFDRLLMLKQQETSIRAVIASPALADNDDQLQTTSL